MSDSKDPRAPLWKELERAHAALRGAENALKIEANARAAAVRALVAAGVPKIEIAERLGLQPSAITYIMKRNP